jgi:hypothetical protein
MGMGLFIFFVRALGGLLYIFIECSHQDNYTISSQIMPLREVKPYQSTRIIEPESGKNPQLDAYNDDLEQYHELDGINGDGDENQIQFDLSDISNDIKVHELSDSIEEAHKLYLSNYSNVLEPVLYANKLCVDDFSNIVSIDEKQVDPHKGSSTSSRNEETQTIS